MDNDNGYTTRDQLKDAAGAFLFVAFAYACWCLVAVM